MDCTYDSDGVSKFTPSFDLIETQKNCVSTVIGDLLALVVALDALAGRLASLVTVRKKRTHYFQLSLESDKTIL